MRVDAVGAMAQLDDPPPRMVRWEGGVRPYFVCRLSGLPVEAMASMRAGKTIGLLEALRQSECELSTQREVVSQLLHDAIPGVQDRADRRRLLTLRRDLYNLRTSRGATSLLIALLPHESRSVVVRFCRQIEGRQRLRVRLAAAYEMDKRGARVEFRLLLQNEDFRRGLVLSSPSLFAALEDYLSPSPRVPEGRERRIERGLLRYVSRMAMKSTPFSTFCTVMPGKFTRGRTGASLPSAQLQSVGQGLQKMGFVRLNKALCGILLEYVCNQPKLRKLLPVERNPTLRIEGGELVFLAQAGGKEVVRRVAGDPALRIVLKHVPVGARLSPGGLAQRLLRERRVVASAGEARGAVDKLLDIGVLRRCSGVREQDVDWDLTLRRLLRRTPAPNARELRGLLRQLRVLRSRYSEAPASERLEILATMRQSIDSSLERLGIAARPARNLPVYEDAVGGSVLELAGRGYLAPALESLLELMRLALPMASPRAEQAQMRDFFDAHYAGSTSGIPLLRFYEDFYRYRRGAAGPRQESPRDASTTAPDRSRPPSAGFVTRVWNAQRQLSERIRERWAQARWAEEIPVRASDLEEAAAGLELPAGSPRSISLFIQPAGVFGVPPKARLFSPAATCFSGYGKYFSRFLYMLPEWVCRRTRRDNRTLCDEQLAEICGDAHFNANLHPRLLPWEICYPTGERGSASRQVVVSDLRVRPDPQDEHALELVRATSAKRVIPVDLGFLNPRMRPALFRLLSHFTPAIGFAIRLPDHWSADGTRSSDTGCVVYRPRIVFDDAVVLARRRWYVQKAALPRCDEDGGTVGFFAAVQAWRLKHDIPREVYVKIRPADGDAGPTPEGLSVESAELLPQDDQVSTSTQVPAVAARRSTRIQEHRPRTREARDFHKPQYVDLTNPLLVDLFGKLGADLHEFTMVIEERLPTTEALPGDGSGHYAAEFVVLMDFRPNASPGGSSG